MPIELGSFDVIIGMDWLSKYHALIDCAEKIVRIPWGNETLIVHGDGSNQGNGTRLKNHFMHLKTHKNLLKRDLMYFWDMLPTRETEDKSGEKQLEDVPIVQDFPKVFPEELPARAPYRLAPSEMKELSEQLQELSNKDPVPHLGELRSCLAGYYRRFIEGFSKIAKPMTKLTQKKVTFEWGDKQEAAFQTLKNKLCSAPILALPQGAENFIVYCDASHKGLGAVLMQNEKVIAYASRQAEDS
ncbi:putative reverse transcriptase domain-containing protein [Tanacetum coccineum]